MHFIHFTVITANEYAELIQGCMPLSSAVQITTSL